MVPHLYRTRNSLHIRTCTTPQRKTLNRKLLTGKVASVVIVDSQGIQGKYEMASQIPSTDEQEQAMRQLAVDSLLLLPADYKETDTFLLDRSDFWAVVMGERPNLPDPLSLPELSPELQQVEEEALKEHAPELPRRNPPRAAKPQEPLLTDMRPEILQQKLEEEAQKTGELAQQFQEVAQQLEAEALDEGVTKRRRRNPPRAAEPQEPLPTDMSPESLQRVEDEALGAHVPKRPRRILPRATKSQEQEACPSLPDSRPNKRPGEDEAPDERKPKRGGIHYPRVPAGACPYSRPLLPTSELIVEAFLSDPHKQMSIKEIKEYLQTKYPWFTWGSARSNVSTTIRGALGDRRPVLKPFEEVSEKQGYWRVTAEYLQYLRRIGSIPA